jgi:hypothetical protein
MPASRGKLGGASARRLVVSSAAGALAGLLPGCSFPEIAVADAPTDDSGQAAFVDVVLSDGGARGDADARATTPGDGGTTLEAAVASEASSPDARSGADAGCDFNGTWATQISIDVSWQPQGLTSVILQPGSGTIVQWVKGVRTQNPAAPTALTDQAVVCGISLPDFQATALGLNQVYGIRFPDTLFDDQYVPPFTVNGALNDSLTTYSSTATAVLLGLTMANPTTDPWPASITTADDMDQDGNPGVTVAAAQGPLAAPKGATTSYSFIPTGIPSLVTPYPAATTLYLAIRQVTILSGAVQDCNTISGQVTIPVIASKPAIDSHVLGCTEIGGSQCTTGSQSQASFVDNSQPVFTPSGNTTFTMIRMPDTATCADVRGAFH